MKNHRYDPKKSRYDPKLRAKKNSRSLMKNLQKEILRPK